MYLDKIVSILKGNSIKLNPCSFEDVLSLEGHFKIKLPKACKEFLLTMGRGAGKFLHGSDCFFSQLFVLKESAKELILENKLDFALPNDAFVFYMHQGYQVAYFLANSETEDPVIYYFSEGDGRREFVETKDTFSIFMEKMLLFSGLK